MDRPDGYDALPKRFKDYIRKVENTLTVFEKARPTQRTRVRTVEYLNEGAAINLADRVRIEFDIRPKQQRRTEPDYDRIHVRLSDDGRGVEVSGYNGRLCVLPDVSNCVTIVSRLPWEEQ